MCTYTYVCMCAADRQHVGCVYSGIGADAKLLVRRARRTAEIYRVNYDEPIPVKQTAKRLGGVAQDFTQSGGVRPFGVSLLVAGYDEVKGAQLYQVDPSGAWWAWKASAIGKNQHNAKHFLEKRCVCMPVCLFACVTH